MSELLRCFFAVKLPVPATEAVAVAQERLRDAAPEWKWVDPKTFHLTLKFLGEVQREVIQDSWRSVAAHLAGVNACRVSLQGLGVFPNEYAPRVVWAGVEVGAKELATIAARIDEACCLHGFERERRPFSAHLTLGRAREPREPREAPRLMAVVKDRGRIAFGEGTVDRVLLMRSTLTRSGAVYDVIHEHTLQQGEAL